MGLDHPALFSRAALDTNLLHSAEIGSGSPPPFASESGLLMPGSPRLLTDFEGQVTVA